MALPVSKFKVDVDEREEAGTGMPFPVITVVAAAIRAVPDLLLRSQKGEAPVNACPVGGETGR